MQLLSLIFLLVKKTVYRLWQKRLFPVTFCENKQMEIPAQLSIVFINTKPISRMTSQSVTQRLNGISENRFISTLALSLPPATSSALSLTGFMVPRMCRVTSGVPPRHDTVLWKSKPAFPFVLAKAGPTFLLETSIRLLAEMIGQNCQTLLPKPIAGEPTKSTVAGLGEGGR